MQKPIEDPLLYGQGKGYVILQKPIEDPVLYGQGKGYVILQKPIEDPLLYGQGKGYVILQKPIEDPLFPAKLKLIKFLFNKLNKFLRGFQTGQPVIPLQ